MSHHYLTFSSLSHFLILLKYYNFTFLSPYSLITLLSYPLISSYLIATITCGVDGSRGCGLRLALVPTFLLSHPLTLLFLSSYPLSLILISSYLLTAIITCGVDGSRGYCLIIISPYSLIILSSYLISSYLIATITCGVDGSKGCGLRLALVPTFLLSHRLIILLPYLRIILSYPLILLSSYPRIILSSHFNNYLWC